MNQGSDLGRLLRAALYGALLSLGLTLGGVARAEIVLGGLDLVDFDPRLYVFFAGALFTFGALFRLSRRRTQPYCAARFSEPPQGKVDGRLVAGAALFGLGWGLTGVCPGPAVVGLATGTLEAWLFFGVLLVTLGWPRRGVLARTSETTSSPAVGGATTGPLTIVEDLGAHAGSPAGHEGSAT